MKQNILYVGLDVDDTQYHGAAFNKDTTEVVDFKCRPTLKGHMGRKKFREIKTGEIIMQTAVDIKRRPLEKARLSVLEPVDVSERLVSVGEQVTDVVGAADAGGGA